MGKEVHIATSPIRYKGLTCPQCLAPAEGMTQLSPRRKAPILEPGCAVVCIECGEINIVTKNIGLRRATASEWREMMGDPIIRIAVQAASMAQEMQKLRGGRDAAVVD